MPRKSLGQVRLYELECDSCTKQERIEVRGQRVIYPLPWHRLTITINESRSNEPLISCSPACSMELIALATTVIGVPAEDA